MSVQTQPLLSAREKMANARLYGVTLPPAAGQSYAALVESACKGGADVVQLRDKTLSIKELLATARELAMICHRYGVLFIVNDRLDVALASGADGVHVGQEDLPVTEARRIAKAALADQNRSDRDFLIGCSTHSLEQALKAQADGADYLGCGPVYATPTKPSYGQVGLELVRQYRERIPIPFVAIGGIDSGNVGHVAAAGARCVAAVRALFGAPDVERAAREMKSRLGSL